MFRYYHVIAVLFSFAKPSIHIRCCGLVTYIIGTVIRLVARKRSPAVTRGIAANMHTPHKMFPFRYFFMALLYII